MDLRRVLSVVFSLIVGPLRRDVAYYVSKCATVSPVVMESNPFWTPSFASFSVALEPEFLPVSDQLELELG